jgi:hypothetical protein
MIPLLQSPRDKGYPDDFLIARIKGRGPGLRELRELSYSAGPEPGMGPGPDPVMEHLWVYERMRPGLREAMSLFFVHAELWRVFICLRYALRRKGVPGTAVFMRGSVLSDAFRDQVSSPLDCSEAARLLSDSMLEPFGAGSIEPALCGRISTEGLISLEREVYTRVIRAGARSISEAMREYFRYMADRYNLLGLIKSMRLGLEQMPLLVEGGRFAADTLVRAFDQRRGDVLTAMAGRLTGEKPPGSAASVHLSFTRGLLRRMSRLERAHPLHGAILAHLVRAQVLVGERRVAELASGQVGIAA